MTYQLRVGRIALSTPNFAFVSLVPVTSACIESNSPGVIGVRVPEVVPKSSHPATIIIIITARLSC